MRGPKVHPDYLADKPSNKFYIKMVLQIIALLDEFFGDEDKAILWLETPNLNFGSAKPIDLIKTGRANKVLLFCQNCKHENSPPTVKTH
jgi:uncharacterized protein (DUF2384 family)